MNNLTTATAEKIFACYMEYIHTEKVIAITNPHKETLIAPIVEPLVQAQADVLPVYQQAAQQCQVVHQMLEDAFEKYAKNDAIRTNMHRSHWFMALLYCKMNLLDKAKAQYAAAIQTQKKHFLYLTVEVKPISYACLAYLDNTDPRADACKTMSGKYVVDEIQYDRMDLETFTWDGGCEYFDVHYTICKVLSQQQVAAETIIHALQVTCRYVMNTYNRSKEYDKLAIVVKVLCKIHALLSGDTPITSDCIDQVTKDLSTIYAPKLNPTDKYTDLQEAYQACLDLHEHALHHIYLDVTSDCAIEMGNYADKEDDKQGLYTYYSAAYQFDLERARPDIYPGGHFDMSIIGDLAYDFGRKFEERKMYHEAIEFYKKSNDLGEGDVFDVASLYLVLNRLDDALAYHHECKVYADINRDAALKIDQITSILHIEDNPELVRSYRERFYACSLAEDAIRLDLSNDYWVTCTIWEGETRIGYCCISRWRSLREYYVDETHQHKMAEILRKMIDIELVDEALLSTTHTPAYTVCLSESHDSSEERFCYTYSGKTNAEESPLAMQLAREEDIEKIIKFYRMISCYSESYDKWADMVKREELYLYTKGDELVALGECTTYDKTPEVAKVNIGVSYGYRQQGLGTRLLAFLTDKAIEQGRRPIATVEDSYDVDSIKKFVERCGFECSAVIVEMSL